MTQTNRSTQSLTFPAFALWSVGCFVTLPQPWIGGILIAVATAMFAFSMRTQPSRAGGFGAPPSGSSQSETLLPAVSDELARTFRILVEKSSSETGAEMALVSALEQLRAISGARVCLLDEGDDAEIELGISREWASCAGKHPRRLVFALPDWGSQLSYRIEILPNPALGENLEPLRQWLELLLPLVTAHLNGLASLRETDLARNALRQANRQLDAIKRQVLAQERSALLGRLVANLAHELNNPVLGIQGCVTVLKESSADSDVAREMIESIHRESQRCMEILLSVIGLGDDETPSRQKIQIDELVAQTIKVLTYEARQGEVRLEHIHPTNTSRLSADPVLLRQALLNLVQGAIRDLKGTQGPREIVITTEQGMDHIRLKLETSPLGTGTESDSSTRLGLWVAQAVVESLSGHIQVQRDPEKPMTIVLVLPIRGRIADKEKVLQGSDTAPSIQMLSSFRSGATNASVARTLEEDRDLAE